MLPILLLWSDNVFSFLRWLIPLIFLSLLIPSSSVSNLDIICRPSIYCSLLLPSYWSTYINWGLLVRGSFGWRGSSPPPITLSPTISVVEHWTWPPTPEFDFFLSNQTLTYDYCFEVLHFGEKGEGGKIDFTCLLTFLLRYISYSDWYVFSSSFFINCFPWLFSSYC